MTHPNWTELGPEAQNAWDQNAAFWDDYMGDNGNHFYQYLIKPTAEALLNIQPGETVLEIACGNGNFSRHLARLGAQVTATDFSQAMIAQAQSYPTDPDYKITCQVVDAASKAQLLALGSRRFDAAVSNMALMDINIIEPLFEALAQLLKPGGRFVFSLAHPCFQSHGTAKVVEETEQEDRLATRYALKISDYITPKVSKGLAVEGQPTSHYYFHRPLSMLFKAGFQAGFVVTGLEEPIFPGEVNFENPFSWANFKEFPPVLFARLRLL